MGTTFVRGKENYSLAEKKELGELVEKCKKKDDKEVKAICHFSMQKVTPRIFQPPLSPPPPPRLLYFRQIFNLLLIRNPPSPSFIRDLRVIR